MALETYQQRSLLQNQRYRQVFVTIRTVRNLPGSPEVLDVFECTYCDHQQALPTEMPKEQRCINIYFRLSPRRNPRPKAKKSMPPLQDAGWSKTTPNKAGWIIVDFVLKLDHNAHYVSYFRKSLCWFYFGKLHLTRAAEFLVKFGRDSFGRIAPPHY